MSIKKSIILGGWQRFSEAHGLFKKEAVEDFSWMSKEDIFFYNDARAAIDATPGAREFLRSLKPEESSSSSIVDAVKDKMSSLHSGTSMSCLMGCYRAALRDWDTWVLETKNQELLGKYKQKQIELIPLMVFYNHLTYWRPVTDEAGFKVAMENAKVIFSDGKKPLEVSWDGGAALDIITTLLNELQVMRKEEETKWKAKRLRERVEYLEWNLKNPSRWFWPGEQDPRYNIRPDEMAELERLHPGYRVHIDLICQHINTMGYKRGSQWNEDISRSLNARLIELGIMDVCS